MAARTPLIVENSYYGHPIDGDYIDRKWLPPDLGGGGGNTSRIYLRLDNYFDNRSLDKTTAIIPYDHYYNRYISNGVFIHPIRPNNTITYKDPLSEVDYKIRPFTLRFKVYFKDIVEDKSAENEWKREEPKINELSWKVLEERYKLKLKLEVITETHMVTGRFMYTSAGVHKILNISTNMNILEVKRERIEFSDIIDQRVDITYETMILEGQFPNSNIPMSIPFVISMSSARYEYNHRYMYVDYYPSVLPVYIDLFKYYEISEIPDIEKGIKVSVLGSNTNLEFNITDNNHMINITLSGYGIYKVINNSKHDLPTLYIYLYANHFHISTQSPLNIDGSLL